VPETPEPKPGTKDQVNFTDEQSRIMKTKDGFQHCYNAQVSVETASRLIVGPRVSQAPNDKKQPLPNLIAVQRHLASTANCNASRSRSIPTETTGDGPILRQTQGEERCATPSSLPTNGWVIRR
jgi:hypothetical protein